MAEEGGDYTPKNILVTGGAGEFDGIVSYRLGIGRRPEPDR
jgi:hypothetical protein